MNNEIENKTIFATNSGRQALPYATASLVLGILSIVFCFTYGIIGTILGIIGLVLSNKDRSIYRLNPELYSVDSYKNSNAGRTCAIVGLILSLLFLVCIICFFIFAVSMATFPLLNH